jgi:L-Ala-D/L-Glu epimerase
MKIKRIPYQLFFKYPFKIAHTTRSTTDNMYLVLEKNGEFGIGEAVFPPYQKENLFSVCQLIQSYRQEIEALKNSEEALYFLNNLFENNKNETYAIACLDTALIDLFDDEWLNKKLDLSPKESVETSYTIGISNQESFVQKIKDSASKIDYFKLKIDQENYQWILDLYPKITSKPLVLDANQGFKDFKAAVDCLEKAKSLDAKYVEQLFSKHDFDSHKKLKELKILPIIADESFQIYDDLDKTVESFDGINVKLMKCGGLNQASKIIEKSRKLGLLSILGCMSDSEIGMQNARKIAHQTNWADLDGHLLNTNSPTRNFLLTNNNLTLS